MNRELIQMAKAIPKSERMRILRDLAETELHQALKNLYERIEPDYTVAITHGSREFGKDLILYRRDSISATVTALVVKAGDVKGKTAGDIDGLKKRTKAPIDSRILAEIISQIEQSRDHDVDLKMVLEELRVSNILVVLSGLIGSNAKARIKAEIRDVTIGFRDLEWLVTNFSNFYPEIFFDAAVLDFSRKQIMKLENSHWLGAKNKLFSEVFIEPLVTDYNVNLELSEESIKKMIHKDKFPFSRLEALVKGGRRILLVGEPGVGKSGCVTKITLDIYKDILNKASISGNHRKAANTTLKLPITIPARRLETYSTAENVLEEYSKLAGHPIECEILIIDAIDEVQELERESLIKRAIEFADKFNSGLLITSRPLNILNADVLASFEKYELLNLEFTQALKLIEKVVGQRSKLLQAMTKGLQEIRGQIPLVPLSMMLLIQLIEENHEIPASLTELYDRYLELILGKWDKEKGIEVLFEYHIKNDFLKTLAYEEFYQKNLGAIPYDQYLAQVNRYAEKFLWDESLKERFVVDMHRIGVLQINKMVLFQHRSFLEYFIAKYIFDNREDIQDLNGLIRDLYFSELWSDVAFFYVGHKREISAGLLELILGHTDETIKAHMEKLSIGRLLQAGWRTHISIKTDGTNKALDYLPRIRNKFLELIKGTRKKTPEIFVDLFLYFITDISFNSGFLERSNVDVIDRLISNGTYDDLIKAIFLLRPLNSATDSVNILDYSRKILTGLKVLRLSEEDEHKAISLIGISTNMNKQVGKIVRSRAKELVKRHQKHLRKKARRF